MTSNKRVLIIGGTGLLGRALIEVGKEKYELYKTYHIVEPSEKDENFIKLSVENRDEICNVFSKIKPDYVIDTHALTNVDHCELHKEEAWAINVISSKNVLDASEKVGAKYIFISSDYVFDGYGPADKSEEINIKNIKPYTEESKQNPLNFYGLTKAIMEDYLYFSKYDYLVIRTSAIYGNEGSTGKKSFVQFIVENLKANKQVSVVSDQYLSPTNNIKLATVIYKLIEKGKSGIYNVCGKNMSKYEWAIKIAKRENLNINLINPIKTKELNQVAKRPFKPLLSMEKLRKELGDISLSDF